ncbi:MAG: CDP-alcohol phosphatidyltransferase family protein, partial [Chloroflexota bacterium]
MVQENSIRLTKLRWQWALYGIMSFVGIVLTMLIVSRSEGQTVGRRWVSLPIVMMLIQLISLWRILPQNHRAGETQILATFGLGNNFSLIRGTLIAIVAGFIIIPRPSSWLVWLPVILYFIASVFDYLDGYFARITNHATQLGAVLDINSDSLGVLIVTLLAYHFGSAPWWYVPFGFAR